MNIAEKITIMKHETRLANRTTGDGLKNWTPEARAKSLAVRRAKGSVWGWDKRPRGSAESLSPGFDRIMEDIEKDAPRVRRIMELHASGTPTIGPRDKYADELAAQQLEAFKAWLAEVKRVEGAIDQFNGTVAALGGLTGGMAKAQRGQRIGPVKPDAAADAAAKKAAVEKSIRRNFEKKNADYLRKYPEERPVMLDMVAEKAEYYSAQPARKVEMEKEAYRRIRDEGISSMREVSDYAAEFKTALEAKRTYVRERDAVKPQLHIDEVAYPVGNGRWVAQMPDGSERVINASPAPVVLKLKTPAPAPKKTGKLIEDTDWADMLKDSRYLIGGRYFDHVANRHTSRCSVSTSSEKTCKCSCGGKEHGIKASSKNNDDYVPYTDKDGRWSKDERRRQTIQDVFEKTHGKDYRDAEGQFTDEQMQDAIEDYTEKGADKMDPELRAKLISAIKDEDPIELQKLKKELLGGSKKDVVNPDDGGSASKKNPDEMEPDQGLVDKYKKLIELGGRPQTKDSQIEGPDKEKRQQEHFEVLREAWHTHSLDKFQDKYGRDPKNNEEFRKFQKEIRVPVEFIGGQ